MKKLTEKDTKKIQFISEFLGDDLSHNVPKEHLLDIGKKGYITIEKKDGSRVDIPVLILNVKNGYGRIRHLVAPIGGGGEMWSERVVVGSEGMVMETTKYVTVDSFIKMKVLEKFDNNQDEDPLEEEQLDQHGYNVEYIPYPEEGKE